VGFVQFRLQAGRILSRAWHPLVVALAGLILLPISAAGLELAEHFEPPKIDSTDVFDYPISEIVEGSYPTGYARLLFELNTNGEVLDCVCLEATNARFAEAAVAGLMAANFSPAKIDGQVEPIRAEIIIHFAYEGVRAVNAMDHWASRSPAIRGRALEYALVAPKELDLPPQLIDRGQVQATVDAEGEIIHGTVLIECYLDHHGLPRMPRVEDASDPRLNQAALESVKTLRFSPPKKGDAPAVIKIKIPFRFGGNELR
jgi:TonB family protein